MKIAKYISDLLFEYECIVIPDFGGFITKDKSAQILPIQNHFVPPSKDIVFNVHLKANDGLLVNYIAKKENLTYIEARAAVERFAKRCKQELENGKQIRFRKVGVLYLDKEENICFEADQSQNYLADSFGLKSFVSPDIKRTSQYSGISRNKKSEPKDRSPKQTVIKETKRKEAYKKVKDDTPKYININISFIIILIAIASITIFKFGSVKQFYNNYAGYIPVLSNPDDRVLNDLGENRTLGVVTLIDKLSRKNTKGGKKAIDKEKKAVPKIERKVEDIPKEKDSERHLKNKDVEEAEAEAEVEKEEEDLQKTKGTEEKESHQTEKVKKDKIAEVVVPDEKNKSYKHFIIAGVFKSKTNADNLVSNLKSKGYKASIVGQTNSGYYRVCFEAFKDLRSANQQLAVIRRKENDAAWLYSI